jgi:hypothetical protein
VKENLSGTREERDRRLREIGVDPEQIVDDRDAEYMLGASAEQQKAIVCTLTSYRYPDVLEAGDPLPDVMLHPLDATEPVALRALGGGRPLVLFFGSYT